MNKLIIFLTLLFFNLSVCLAEDLLPIISENRVGYINANGEVKINPNLDTDIEWATETYQHINYKLPKFPINAYFSDGKAVAKIKARFWGIPYSKRFVLINTHGEIIRDSIDSRTGRYIEGIAIAEEPNVQGINDNDKPKYTYIDPLGIYLTKLNFLYAGEFHEGKALTLQDSLFGFIDIGLDWIIKPQFQLASHFSEGLAPASHGKLYGYINEKAEFVLPEMYEHADQFYSGIALVYKNGKPDYINKKGETINKLPFQRAFRFSYERALVEYQNAYGFIGTDGEFAIKPLYDAAENFSEGLAAVCLNGKWGFIDTNNNFIIQPTYDYVKSFQNGAALAYQYGVLSYINKDGKKIFTFNE